MKEVMYAVEAAVTAEEFRQVLLDSGLWQRRPVDDLARLDRMLRNAHSAPKATTAGVA